MKKFLLNLAPYIVFVPLLAWAVDARIEQQMGTIVQEQMNTQELERLDYIKRARGLTDQEKRDYDFYKAQLDRLRGVKK